MRRRSAVKPRSPQAGFSMVEMLMAAFVLAIGLLGLASLQVMSMKTTRGGQSLTTAVQLAERVMDQIELEGRLSWLNISDSSFNPTALGQLQYVGVVDADSTVFMAFDEDGQPQSDTPVAAKPTGRYVATVSATTPTTASQGNLSDYFVTLEFYDSLDKDNKPITRTVTITRRILHG